MKTTAYQPTRSFFDDFFAKSIGQASNQYWGTNTPAVNISEGKEGFQLELSVPGYKKEHFNLKTEKNLLEISAQLEEETSNEPTEVKYIRLEFTSKNFKRTFQIPDTIDTSKIEAQYINGILTLSLPLKEESIPSTRQISIK